MFPSLLLRQEPKIFSAEFPYTLETNPYKAQKQWPPDFAKLSQKHQFRLERRYRRRAKLKWARPQWQRYSRLLQWGLSLGVIGYAVLYMDWGADARAEADPPFKAIRDWYSSLADSIWTHTTHHPEDIRGRRREGDNPRNPV